MDQEPELVVAAGVICKAPSGRVLLMHRTDGEGWAWPGGTLKDGEDAAQAAWREVFEECQYRLGGVGAELMRSVKNGIDFTTFVCPVESEFIPVMNHEHDAYMWTDPEAALEQAKATDRNGSVSGATADSMARADATPVVGGEGASELSASLEQGMLQDEAERVADQDNDLEQELGEEEGPAAPAPLYPVADFPVADQDLLEDDPEDDLDPEMADLILEELEALDARLQKIENQAAQ